MLKANKAPSTATGSQNLHVPPSGAHQFDPQFHRWLPRHQGDGSGEHEALKTLPPSPLPRQEAHARFWQQVLESLAISATSVTVLDSYLFKAVLDIADGRPWARYWLGEHVTWLLRHLDAVMSDGAKVHLLGNMPNDYGHFGPEDIADGIHDQWQPAAAARLGTVRISVVNPRQRAGSPIPMPPRPALEEDLFPLRP